MAHIFGRLHTNDAIDFSGVGFGQRQLGQVQLAPDDGAGDVAGIAEVQQSHMDLRRLLIAHFDVLYQAQTLVWPKRNGR
jgi:hypothetical protein